ncbi:hypothetical protein AB0C52_03070 [Streptomyces sp. NPDC048717]|uniref:hypothetical protein n=1 Tax=Streptomyces sp. NPDC048717 TaxID=3154928 RepID=UPI00342551D7
MHVGSTIGAKELLEETPRRNPEESSARDGPLYLDAPVGVLEALQAVACMVTDFLGVLGGSSNVVVGRNAAFPHASWMTSDAKGSHAETRDAPEGRVLAVEPAKHASHVPGIGCNAGNGYAFLCWQGPSQAALGTKTIPFAARRDCFQAFHAVRMVDQASAPV